MEPNSATLSSQPSCHLSSGSARRLHLYRPNRTLISHSAWEGRGIRHLAARNSGHWTPLFIESQVGATIESLTSLLFPERTGVSIRSLVSSTPRRRRIY